MKTKPVEPPHKPNLAWAMGYEWLWVQIGCKFQFVSGPKLCGIGGYGLREVWVMRLSTVSRLFKLLARAGTMVGHRKNLKDLECCV